MTVKDVKLDTSGLKGMMAKHGITIDVMAKKMGIARSTLSRKINGYYDFTICEALLLASEFGCSMDELFCIQKLA